MTRHGGTPWFPVSPLLDLVGVMQTFHVPAKLAAGQMIFPARRLPRAKPGSARETTPTKEVFGDGATLAVEPR
jgi:hypothetical protein